MSRLQTPTYIIVDADIPHHVHGFWSPNALRHEFPTTIPARGDTPGHVETEGVFERPKFKDITTMQWLLRWEVRNAFVPLNPNYRSELLSCVNYTPKTLPVRHLGKATYGIEQSVIDDWHHLEHILLRICDIMSPSTLRLMPLSAPSLTYPSNIGLHRTFVTEGEARLHGMRILTRMYQLFGEAAFSTTMSNANWKTKLPIQDPHIFTARMMNMLQDSLLLDFTRVRRTGALVNVDEFYKYTEPSQRLCFRRIADAGIPLFFLFVTADLRNPLQPLFKRRQTHPITPLLSEHGPEPPIIADRIFLQPHPRALMQEFDSLIHALGIHTSISTLTPCLENVDSTSNPLRGSPSQETRTPTQTDNPCTETRQRPRSHPSSLPPTMPVNSQDTKWASFFARRSAALEHQLATLSQNDIADIRARQKQAEELNRHITPPSQSGDSFYIWEESPTKPGSFLRKPVRESYLDQYWEFYERSQRIYDPLSREWDLCHLMDPVPHVSWSFFFKRREAEKQTRLTEGSMQTLIRLRDNAAKIFNDGNRILTMKALRNHQVLYKVDTFIWEKKDVEGGFARVQVTRDEFVSAWKKHSFKQRIYDAVQNEWDICPPMDATPADESGSDVDDDQGVSTDDPTTSTQYTGLAPISDCSVQTFSNQPTIPDAERQELAQQSIDLLALIPLERLASENTEEEIQELNRFDKSLPMKDLQRTEHKQWSILEWISVRYGFIKPPHNRVHPSVPDDVRKRWTHYLGVRDLPQTEIDNIASEIHYFVHVLHNSVANPLANLERMIDLNPANPQYIIPSQALIRIEKVVLHLKEEKRRCYCITPKSLDTQLPWFMVVEEASSIVLAIRMKWGQSMVELVQNFLEYGLPFRTFKIQRATTSTLPPRPSFLPKPPRTNQRDLPPSITSLRAPNRDFNLTDYVEYEDAREAFFSGPRGRSVIGFGGLIRRLYQLNDDNNVSKIRYEHVINGPSDLAAINGENAVMYCPWQSFLHKSVADDDIINVAQSTYQTKWIAIKVYDDFLSLAEQEYLLGLYDTQNVPFHHQSQLTIAPRPSWFQHPSIFLSNHFGRNGGIWSPNEEIAFRKRLDNIAKHQLTLSKDDQKSTLRTATKRVDQTYENLCQRYLEYTTSPYWYDG